MFDCQIVTVEADQLPPGHDFVLIEAQGRQIVFAAPSDRAQIDARVAVFEWDRTRGLDRAFERLAYTMAYRSD